MVALNHVDLDPRHDWDSLAFDTDELYACWKGHSIVPSTNRKPPSRCGHYEQVKLGTNWKCVACGQILTVSQSIQNSIDLSEVMRSAIESRRPLSESLDDLLGHREWEGIRAKIPSIERQSTSKRRKRHVPKRKLARG